MAVELLFNLDGIEPIVKTPTLVLAKKSGIKIGAIPCTNIRFESNLNSADTFDFKVYKTINGVDIAIWDDIKDFRLLWCKEWDMWFEIKLDITQSDSISKSVNCTALGEAELSSIKLYNIEINTEADIERDDYVPTILYNFEDPNGSLLNRICDKAPHYTIKHVDSSIANIQRTFTFNDTSLHDAFNTISEEIGCLFIISNCSDENDAPERGIYVYDLMSHCNECGYREDYFETCPECGSADVESGYGEDSGIFITDENLANEITSTVDQSNVYNCFKLEAGDDLMTSTIANLNPNGSEYLWNIPDYMLLDMSDELVSKLEDYEEDYAYYSSEYELPISDGLLDSYNSLINKYSIYNEDLEPISSYLGFNSLINIFYSTIDLELYLTDGLMPSPSMKPTDATEQAALLTAENLSPISVSNISVASATTVKLNVLSVAKTVVLPTFSVEVVESTYDASTHVWTGSFKVSNYSNEDDTATTGSISITITDEYSKYIEQKIHNVLNRGDTDDYSVSSLFKKEILTQDGEFYGDFVNELKKYGLSPLKNFHDICQSCLDVLIGEGVSDKTTWDELESNLYNDYYKQYYLRLQAIEAEISVRDSEIKITHDLYDEAVAIRDNIHGSLNLRSYIGDTLWKEFCSFRRESTYSNNNYISDGLTNAELLKTAEAFINVAKKDLEKSSNMQHMISSSLNSLLLLDPKFKSLKDSFDVGNWIRVKIDGKIYRLRLVSYSVDFDNLNELTVEFSDAIEYKDDISDVQSILSKATSIASTYQNVERQTDKNAKASVIINTWFEDGLDATTTRIVNNAESQDMTFGEHGMLIRKFDDVTESYYDEQVKIINSTIAITDDNWLTTKTAVGKFHYVDPVSGDLKTAFGVNGETIVGKMIIGQSLALYNQANTLRFDENGLCVENNTNKFIVNPSLSNLFTVKRGNDNLLTLDENGDLLVKGHITANSLSTGGKTSQLSQNDGLFINSSGDLFSGGNNQTQIFHDGRIILGAGSLSWDNTTLTVTGTVNANNGSFGAINPFIIGDNGFNGSFTSSSASTSTNASEQINITNNGSFSNSFSISVTKQATTGTQDTISLTTDEISISVNYSYSRTISEVVNGETISTTVVVDGIDTLVISSSSYYESSISTSVSGGNAIYSKTYTFNASDMNAYLQELVKTNNPSIEVNASAITISSAVVNISYTYYFSQYTVYSHIGTDSLNYFNIMIVDKDRVNLGNTTIRDLSVTNNINMGFNTQILGKMASNDYWRLIGAGSKDSGYCELATADNGTEPIYVSQYTGIFEKCVRYATLLDGNGDTLLPGTLAVRRIRSQDGSVKLSNPLYIPTYISLGSENLNGEKQIFFMGSTHDSYIYGGKNGSNTAIGIWDRRNNRGVLHYDDTSNTLYADTQNFYCYNWANNLRKPISASETEGHKISAITTYSTGISIYGQWAETAIVARSLSVPSSDIRLKENIKKTEIKSALDALNKIAIRSFDWKATGEHQKIGIVADEIEKIDPKFSIGGGYDEEGNQSIKTVDTFYMLGYVLKAIQELSEKVSKLEKG